MARFSSAHDIVGFEKATRPSRNDGSDGADAELLSPRSRDGAQEAAGLVKAIRGSAGGSRDADGDSSSMITTMLQAAPEQRPSRLSECCETQRRAYTNLAN